MQIFSKEYKDWNNNNRICLTLGKLVVTENGCHSNYVLLRKSSYINFNDTINVLCKTFSKKSSRINICWKCFKREKNEDYVTYAGRVYWGCKKFTLDKLSQDVFKCLIFTQWLINRKDAEVRTRILAKQSWNKTRM